MNHDVGDPPPQSHMNRCCLTILKERITIFIKKIKFNSKIVKNFILFFKFETFHNAEEKIEDWKMENKNGWYSGVGLFLRS